MALVDDVLADVEKQTTVIDSAIALLKQIKALLDAAGTDPVKLQAIKDLVDKDTQKIADAIVENTPSA